MSARLPAGPPTRVYSGRCHSVILRMNRYERAALRHVAKSHGLTMSAMLRKLLLAEDDRLHGAGDREPQ